MWKKIGIESLCAFYFYTFKKTKRPLAEMNDAIYGVADDYFVSQYDAANSVIIFKNGHTQPMGKGKYMNPDIIKIQIQSMNTSHGKTFKLSNLSINKLIPVFIIIAVLASIGYTLLR